MALETSLVVGGGDWHHGADSDFTCGGSGGGVAVGNVSSLDGGSVDIGGGAAGAAASRAAAVAVVAAAVLVVGPAVAVVVRPTVGSVTAVG